MELVRLDTLFDVKYGSNLELNALTLCEVGINFVSRTSKNNGVSAIVKPLKNINPLPAGVLTVAGGGSVLETFLQSKPFYSGRDLYYLVPKFELNEVQLLYYAKCIRLNKYKYSYGRQANRTLKSLLVPSIANLPDWLSSINLDTVREADKSFYSKPSGDLNLKKWAQFKYDSLFEIKKGKRLTKLAMTSGDTPFLGSSATNNGITNWISIKPIHEGNTICVNYNGSVGEAFYQDKPFWASDDVNVLYPKNFIMTPAIALFFCTLIRAEKFRFNYGRKWHLERMRSALISLPITDNGTPDFELMEKYIKSLPYSSQL